MQRVVTVTIWSRCRYRQRSYGYSDHMVSVCNATKCRSSQRSDDLKSLIRWFPNLIFCRKSPVPKSHFFKSSTPLRNPKHNHLRTVQTAPVFPNHNLRSNYCTKPNKFTPLLNLPSSIFPFSSNAFTKSLKLKLSMLPYSLASLTGIFNVEVSKHPRDEFDSSEDRRNLGHKALDSADGHTAVLVLHTLHQDLHLEEKGG